jgi:hypothetical protein
MRKSIKTGLVMLLVVGALGVLVSGAVLAQDDTPTPDGETVPFSPRGHRPGFFRGPGGEIGMQAAAEALGMTADELTTQLWGGQSLADLAEEAGVALEDVQAAVQDALDQASREAIEDAVEQGDLTRDHADWLLEGLDQGYWGAGKFGGFGGPGFHRGPGRFGGPINGAFLCGSDA